MPSIGKKSSATIWRRISSGSPAPVMLPVLKTMALIASKLVLRAFQSR
jgi:hypothetical protein